MSLRKLFFIALSFTSFYSFSQNVNPFTGSFSYGQNVLYIPSNRGVGVDVNVSYGAGIQMNQPASEIGLGWGLNAGGAIYRSVSGVPDDVKSYTITNYSTGGQTIIAQGALYPNTTTTSATKGDFFTSKRGLDTSEITLPDFDNFSVSAPGFGGQMKLNYHKFYSNSYNVINTKPLEYGYLSNSASNYYRKPQFHFVGDFADTLTSRHYSTVLTSTTPYRESGDNVTGNGYTNSNEPFIGRHLSGSSISSQNFTNTTGRLGTSNFVEYFTNDEINTASAGNFTSTALSTFIDYKTNHSRSSSSFPADGIGYFRITASNGLTYHYSLPVYQIENTTYRVPLKADYTTETLTVNDFNSNLNVNTYPNPNMNVVIKDKTKNKYAVKWLLTAVTGADYVDVNNNHLVDAADGGYWISYDYQQWSSSFTQRYPFYGYDYQYSPDEYSKIFPQYFPLTPSGANQPYKLSGLFGVTQTSKTEVYHLNKIRTSSHTAIFVRDLRLDEKGMIDTVTIPSNYLPAPDLLLKRVVLFKNEQYDSIIGALFPSGPTGNAFNVVDYPEFNFNNVTNSPNFYTENWFNANFPNSRPGSTISYTNNLNYCILKNVFFDQDYSLCKGYHGNSKVSYNGSTVLSSPNTVETNISNSNLAVSGKLTLNKIYTYDFGNEKVTPSVIFDYDKDGFVNLYANPNYNPKKADYWGYYKNDYTYNSYSRYTTPASKDYTKAWSLVKITDHLGGITEIDYESNAYNKVLDHESANGFRGASYIYRIQSVKDGSNTNNFDVYMEEGNSSSNILSEFGTLCGTSISNIKKRMCLPFMKNIASTAVMVSQVDNFKSLAFGNITTTIINIPSGTSNNLQGTLTPLWSASTNSCYALNDKYNQVGESERKYRYSDPGATLYNSLQSGYNGAYSGNGYIFFETPIGYEVYGGGIRVKKLTSRNASNEGYVKEYTYTDGVAADEADRFEYPRLKTGCASSVSRYDFLQPKEYSKLGMSPMIGYSKVTVKDLGRINSDNGRIEITYLTDPTYQNNAFNKSNRIVTYTSTSGTSPLLLRTIMECTNVFANIFGSQLETKVFDKNGNMLSKSVNTFTTTEQGALVENIHFVDVTYGNLYPVYYGYPVYSNTVCIMRDIPVVLKSSTTYGMGTFQKTETITRDELTGETTSIRVSAKNNSTSYSFKTPAYKYYQGVENIDFTSANLRKLMPLSHDMFTYSNIDSTLSQTLGNGSSASFLGSGYQLYSRLVRQRVPVSSIYTNSQVTLPYYYNNRTFVFDGGSTSIDEYGLLKKSMLNSNPLNLSTINSNVFFEPTTTYNWKLVSEITLLDYYKNIVETRDQNNRFSACRYSNSGYYKSASVSNCNYPSFTFADFENGPIPTSGSANIDGDLIVTNAHSLINYTTLLPHTGSKCIQVNSTPVTYTVLSEKSSGNTLNIGILPGRIYRTSVWVHNTNLTKANIRATVTGSVNNVASSIVYTANSTSNLVTTMGNWNLLQIDFNIPETFVTGSSGVVKIELRSIDGSTVYFDDFVLHPVESSFSANVYNPRNGRVMSSIDGNGLSTNYKYDAAGRMLEVWKEIPGVGYKQVKSYSYNYARGINN